MDGKNRIAFTGFYVMQQLLRDYSIDITDSDDFDYAFIGAHDILDKKISLEASVEYGMKNIEKYGKGGDCFLFDSSDSTSLMAAYEVLIESDSKFLFKNQLLKNREDYKEKTAFNKWFFGKESDLNLGYDISKKDWDRIKLSGWNLGYMAPNGFRPAVQKWYPVNKHKSIDLSAIYSADHVPDSNHGAETVSYTHLRAHET